MTTKTAPEIPAAEGWRVAILGHRIAVSHMAGVGAAFGCGLGFSLGAVLPAYALLPAPRAKNPRNRPRAALITLGIHFALGFCLGTILGIPLILVARDMRHAAAYGFATVMVVLALDWLRGSVKPWSPPPPGDESA